MKEKWTTAFSAAGMCFFLFAATLALGAQKNGEEAAQPVETSTQTFRPEQIPFQAESLKQLKVPDGFQLDLFAQDLGHARMLAVAEDGTVYLTCPRQNRVMSLQDTDGDGKADQIQPVLENLEMVHGIALHGNRMYLAAPTIVWSVERQGDGSWGKPKEILTHLPDGGQHPNRTLAVGPDEKLYITVGSSCNACEETNPEHATILRAGLEGGSRGIFAKGLRNTIGFGWHPVDGRMWGMDHGSDDRGNDTPPEELNLLQEGKDYGWPHAFGNRQPDPIMKPPEEKKMTKEEYARQTEPMVVGYQAHSAPIGMAFYTADRFPERYRNGAFIAMRGSWNRYPPTGYKIVFLRFENEKPVGFEDFVTGFLTEDGKGHRGRLAGVAVGRDGSLLFTDDANGVIYRVSHQGE